MGVSKCAATAVGIGLSVFAIAASAATPEEIRERGKILVAIDVGHAPYGMLDSNARQTGSDVETAQLLAKDLGVALEVVPVSGANRVPYLMTGKVDVVIASFSITEERQKVIDFSRPYGVIPVVVSAPATMDIASPADLAGKEIAVARGTTADIEVTKLLKTENVKANIIRYEDEATSISAISTGQQDLLAAALSTANEVAEQNPNKKLEVKVEMAAYPMAVGLRKSDAELTDWVNEWVTENLRNGELNGIYKKYFHHDLPESLLE
ncbi:transporter substrate-binding domain-containing protein [Paenirhodobacter populi]|uniref:Transporter substrate-binding domain-containing protein n=1 Tax=Paenirhodobacter populi TaxID=2306993 RepID=A0A443J588_9RHOB|nr:transporter substrate-binding domain-containing protein [Sinirhodobacter populi]RWR15483.1 transporter substrate-binding domain-containing protein [Sinirhodobacter populi]